VAQKDQDKQDDKDKEYLAKFPGFKGTPFEGRKGKSDRAVFMELFTGATCPPCVAADLAFDVLMKTYKPSELILVQYHLHVPQPETMTNPSSIARSQYYKVKGVPTANFNGKPKPGLGGPFKFAEKSYTAARGVIDPLLEEAAEVKLAVQTQRKGDQIDINVDVTGLKGASADTKLRILLFEETIRYVGSNTIRFHHNVVRAFPGGVEGQELKEANSKHKASINLTSLRGELTKYLDEFEAKLTDKGKKFANPARPLDFNNLRVIAFVQNDGTREILQAFQAEVAPK